jgi:hypothetical protein
VGSDKEIKVDVRIIAATNKDLQKEISANNFREDLYHRLSVILIHVPSLNERLEDIPLLADHFINHICSEYGMAKKTITPEAIEELQKINWTGISVNSGMCWSDSLFSAADHRCCRGGFYASLIPWEYECLIFSFSLFFSEKIFLLKKHLYLQCTSWLEQWLYCSARCK